MSALGVVLAAASVALGVVVVVVSAVHAVVHSARRTWEVARGR